MKWRVWLCSPLFVLFALCVGGVIINQKNSVSAVSDLTFTLSSTSDIPILCTSTTPCSDYSYLIIESDSSVPNTASLTLTSGRTPSGQFFNYQVSVRSKYIVLDLTNFSFTASNFRDLQVTGYSNFSAGVITLTLSESLGSVPSGSLSITENGTYDVTNYAQAVVDVPPVVEQGDYHDDLVSINNAILIVPAVALVVYFFYAIYKMLLGGKTL